MDVAPAPIEPRLHGSAGLRFAGSALVLLSVVGALLISFLPGGPASPNSLIAVAGLIGMGIVFIGVSLVAHVFESRDLADIGALLDRAEQRNRAALLVSEEVAEELQLDDLSRPGKPGD